MRNGTQSNNLRLVGDTDAETAAIVASFVEEERGQIRTLPILTLFTVSVACATAAIAAGSYAIWLTRQKAARKTLMDVQDILRICQERMHQMEDDLNHLPGIFDHLRA